MGLCKHVIKKTGDQNPKRMKDGLTPLHLAAKEGRLKICSLIMEDLVDKNPRTNSGNTPLHFTAEAGHLKIYRSIMEVLEDKNPEDNDGWTPLHSAASKLSLIHN